VNPNFIVLTPELQQSLGKTGLRDLRTRLGEIGRCMLVLLGSRGTVRLEPCTTTNSPDRATIVLALFDGKGRKLAGWVERAEAGTHRIALVLPPKARMPGRDRLRVRATGGVAKTLPVRILSS